MRITKLLTSIRHLIMWLAVAGMIFISASYFVNRPVLARSIEEIQKEIESYQKELDRLSTQVSSLQTQIAQFDTQIKLAELKITQTEEKVNLLGGRIGQIEVSLDSLTKSFSSRVVETYKMKRLSDPAMLLLLSNDLTEALSRFHYLKKIQEADRGLLEKLQLAQTTYATQRVEQEKLQKDLTAQKNNLTKQKNTKANLLLATKNDEKKYQQLLGGARAELAVALGQGTEVFLRNVAEGDLIGRVIASSSGCSSGQHLHYEIHQGGTILDPNTYLRPISFTYTYTPSEYNYYGTVSPRGSWNWPMTEPIEINQGYGAHGFATTFYPGGVHNGIDLDSRSNTDVKAVKGGKLYAGSYKCGGAYPGTLLYAKVEQEGGITSWYLHMNPL